MLVNILMFFTITLVAVCTVFTYKQFKSDEAADCERKLAETLAARSCKVVLDLADAYQLPNELGMKKVEAIDKCKQAVLEFESDYFVQLEEMERETAVQNNVSLLRTRF